MKIFPGLIFRSTDAQHTKLQVVVSITNTTKFIKAPIWKEGGVYIIGLVSGANVSEIGEVVDHIPENEITHSLNRFRKNKEGR